MRGARYLLPVLIAFTAAACAREPAATYYVVDPATGQPVAMMQQPAMQTQPVYAQAPQYQPSLAQSTPGRGLYVSQPVYAQPQVVQQPVQQPAQVAQGRGLMNSQAGATFFQAQPQSSSSGRGLFGGSQPQAYTQQPQVVQPGTVIQYQGGVGGPYVPAGPVYAAAPYASGYSLDAGDKLRINVFGQDGISNSYTVDAGGYVNLPLIGQIPARGNTTAQLARMIADKLKQGYVREPHVTVEIEQYRPFFILGEVTNPGQYPYVANMTVETAIAIAGGFAPRADKSKVEITRNTPGQQMRGNVPLNYPLNPGDTIVVPERWF
jgi:polysaccharide export outer membrane protein